MKGINICRSIAGVVGTASLTALAWGNCPSQLMALNASNEADSQVKVSENDASHNSSVATLEPSVTAAAPNPATTFQDTDLVSLVPHHGPQNRLAVTLRINQIPVVTFLGTKEELTALSNDQTTDTMERAQTIATRIDQLSNTESFDASEIKVDLDSDTKQYVVKAEDKILVTINKDTVLPENPLSAPETALQTANRLRRLLGGAEPIVSLPAAIQVARASNFDAAATIQRIRGGIASWYGPGFHGRRTANGERFNQNAMTAAHRTLPFGTRVRVTNVRNGQSVVVRINDRGPFTGGRVIDLSAGAARAIGLYSSGVGNVALDVVQ